MELLFFSVIVKLPPEFERTTGTTGISAVSEMANIYLRRCKVKNSFAIVR
jgi:hypothetical protein